MLTDIHTHSTHSSDGRSPLPDMVKTAKSLGIRYFGVSEHFDYEYLAETILIDGVPVTSTTDAARYFSEARALQKAQNAADFTLLAGCEFGFYPAPLCLERYCALAEAYRPDFIVNSVHTVDGVDAWFPEYFAGKRKRDAYLRYFEAVRVSLDAPYPYDIVGHLGYVSRNAPYADAKLRYADFPDALDDILKTIVARGKILEVNSSSRGAGSDFLPDTDILARYYALGGRAVSFASDAHETSRILFGREKVVASLKALGFTQITVPVRGTYIPVAL